MKTSFLALPLLFVCLLACQSKPNSDNKAASTAPVDSTAALNKRPGPDAPRSAADRLVRALYFEHNKTDNPFRAVESRETVDQFFAPALADRIWQRTSKPGAKKRAINPLLNVPDAGITKTWVEPAAVGGKRAVVYVTYQQQGKPAEIRVDLTQTAGRWRITDMLYADGSTLSSQF